MQASLFYAISTSSGSLRFDQATNFIVILRYILNIFLKDTMDCRLWFTL